MGDDSFEAFLDAIKAMVEEVAPSLSPESDWPGALVATTLGNRERDEPLVVSQLPDDVFRSERTKNMLAQVLIPLFVHSMEADIAAFLSTAWVSGSGFAKEEDPETHAKFAAYREKHGRLPATYDELAEVGVVRASEDPKRREAVTVIVRARDGRGALAAGMIKRRPDQHPVIDRWEQDIFSAEQDNPAGRFAEAFVNAYTDDYTPSAEVLADLAAALGQMPNHPWKE